MKIYRESPKDFHMVFIDLDKVGHYMVGFFIKKQKFELP